MSPRKKPEKKPRRFRLWVGNKEKDVMIAVEDQVSEKNVEACLEEELNSFRNSLDCGWKELS
jgi:hypothetical protein